MQDMADNKFQKFVNSSGFPLQIGLKHQIEKTRNQHGWKVLSSEHPWRHASTGSDGFIDLILVDQHDVQVMVIECKRVLNTSWTFLIPSKETKPRRHVNSWLTFTQNNQVKRFNWLDVTPAPFSAESEFCVVPGQDNKSKPMLERTSSELVEATEAFAKEECTINKPSTEFLRIYFPVIITTAEINICNFDPDEINIETGEITNSSFETVPFVRFRKSLTTHHNPSGYRSLRDVIMAQERTIMVVNANEVLSLLSNWDLGQLPHGIL